MPQKEEYQLSLPLDTPIKKSNIIARAKWTAESIVEPRLVAMLASRIEPDDNEFRIHEIRITELFGDRPYKYSAGDVKAIEKVIDKAMSRVVTTKDPSGVISKCNLFFRCRIDPKQGTLSLALHPDVVPHFLHLKRDFTQYNLLEFMKLPSIYSQRIFELLKSWKSEPEFVVSIDDLHDMLASPRTHRENFKEFRIYALEKARHDIHKHTSLRYTWTPIKTGRRVSAIRFSFTARRFAESKIEDARKRSEKELAKSKKRLSAWLEAAACAKEKNGICTLRDRAKSVCAFCDEMGILREISGNTGQSETQTAQ